MAKRTKTEALQATIDKKGYKWKAADTPQSTMSVEEQNNLLGLTVDEAELEATAAAIKSMEELAAVQMRVGAKAAPAAVDSVDWHKNGDWVTPVQDQESCGSCVAFGTVAALESRIRLACKNARMVVDLSEAHLFYCGCGNCCGTGWNFAPALDFCINPGVGLETSFPYRPGNQPCKSGVAPYAKITAWRSVLSMADRRSIIEKGPVVAGMAVYDDFYQYGSGVYKVTSEDFRGYHCICVVGYNNAEKYWICKNSWGKNWGDAGYFKIGYGQAMIDTKFAFYDMDVPCPVPLCKKYEAYLKNVLLVARRNVMLRACLRYYVCGVGRRPLCLPPVIAVVRSVLLVLRICPQYRKPFCAVL